MSTRILVVDDEPDLEALLAQKFRKQMREGSVSFVFARDGVDALKALEEHPDVDWTPPETLPCSASLAMIPLASG